MKYDIKINVEVYETGVDHQQSTQLTFAPKFADEIIRFVSENTVYGDRSELVDLLFAEMEGMLNKIRDQACGHLEQHEGPDYPEDDELGLFSQQAEDAQNEARE